MIYEVIEITADRKTFEEIESTEKIEENSVESICFFLPLIEFLNQVRISEAE